MSTPMPNIFIFCSASVNIQKLHQCPSSKVHQSQKMVMYLQDRFSYCRSASDFLPLSLVVLLLSSITFVTFFSNVCCWNSCSSGDQFFICQTSLFTRLFARGIFPTTNLDNYRFTTELTLLPPRLAWLCLAMLGHNNS